MSVFEILVVDDDPEVIRQLEILLPSDINGYSVRYTFTRDFDLAVGELNARRFDILVSDIYVARDSVHKKPAEADIRARELVDVVRKIRACPIVLFTDGELPEEFLGNPFILTVDKGTTKFPGNLVEAVSQAIATDIPAITRNLHDELDRFTGSFLWSFLEEHWETLRADETLSRAGLDRVIRRRAALQLVRIENKDGQTVERSQVDPVDYYVMPPIGTFLHLGEIIRNKEDGTFRVILTPHCHLTIQDNAERPRAGYILTLKTVPASELLGGKSWGTDPTRKLRARCALPARDVGLPEERYCFLPGFLSVPDLYCDLMQTEAVAYEEIAGDWERIAVLDTPFAEALQASFSKLFGAVGLPILNAERLLHLTTLSDAPKAGPKAP